MDIFIITIHSKPQFSVNILLHKYSLRPFL